MMNSSFSNASTPPRRTSHSPASFASASRVDALYERQPQVAFVDATPSDDEGSVYSAYSPAARREGSTPPQCWSCLQTQRLRSSLKRIELDYLGQIQTLQQQLKHAVAQRSLALQERDELLTSSDAAAAQQSIIAQEAQALRVEVMQVMQERQALRGRVQQLEQANQSAAQQQQALCRSFVEEAERRARAALCGAEEEQRTLLSHFSSMEMKMVQEVAKTTAVATPPRCHAASGTEANGSTVISSSFSPNSTSSPGPSDGGRERRTCSPRPSQRRELSSQHPTQRPSLSSRDSARSSSENALVVSRALQLTHSAEEAEEKVRKAEWRLEQQRSRYEMQLAEERALTAEMQSEMDDLIENELVLLESEARREIERDAAVALTHLTFNQLHCVEQRLLLHYDEQERQQAQPEQHAARSPTQADVLDLVEEGENASWRIEMSEMLSNMQQQLYQLISAPNPSRETHEKIAELELCVRGEAAVMKESLAALLDTSAQARADGDTLREDLAECFSDIEERQCRQEAFLVALSSRAQREHKEKEGDDDDGVTSMLQEILEEVRQQRAVSEKVSERLKEVEAARNTSKLTSFEEGIATTGAKKRLAGPLLDTKQITRHRDPSADMLAAPSPSVSASRRHSLSATTPTAEGDDPQLSTLTIVSDSTVDAASPSSPLQRTQSTAAAISRYVLAEEVDFNPHRVHVDVSAAAEQISALLSDGSCDNSDDDDFASPYEEY